MKRQNALCYLWFGFVICASPTLAAPEITINTTALAGSLSEPLPFSKGQLVGNTLLYATEGTKIFAIATATDLEPIPGPMAIEITVMRGNQIVRHYGPAADPIPNGTWVAPANCKAHPVTCGLEMAELHSDGELVTITASASNFHGSSQAKIIYVVLGADLVADKMVTDIGGFAHLTWSSRNGKFARLEFGASSPLPVAFDGQTNVSPTVKTTFRLKIAVREQDFMSPCGTPMIACSETSVSVSSSRAAPPAGKIWIQPIYLWDNSNLKILWASAHFSGRYVSQATTVCPSQEPLDREFAFDAIMGPLDVGPIGVQTPARVPMTGSNFYLAEVQAGTMCIYANSPEVNLSRVCRKQWDVGISPEVFLNTIPPLSSDCN